MNQQVLRGWARWVTTWLLELKYEIAAERSVRQARLRGFQGWSTIACGAALRQRLKQTAFWKKILNKLALAWDALLLEAIESRTEAVVWR